MDRPASPSSHRARRRAFVLMLVVVVGGAAVWVWTRREPSPVAPTASTPRGSVAPIELGNFDDWNLGRGALAAEHRRLVTEPLAESGSGDSPARLRLASALVFAPPATGRVELRRSVYWSDAVNLKASHVAAAFARRRDAKLGSEAPEVAAWLAALDVRDEGDYTVVIDGVRSEAELTRLAASELLLPIRPDLLSGDQPWLTTLGPYSLKTKPPATAPASSVLELVPNSAYYRGAVTEPQRLAIQAPAG